MQPTCRHPTCFCTVLIVAATLALSARGQQSELCTLRMLHRFVVGGGGFNSLCVSGLQVPPGQETTARMLDKIQLLFCRYLEACRSR